MTRYALILGLLLIAFPGLEPPREVTAKPAGPDEACRLHVYLESASNRIRTETASTGSLNECVDRPDEGSNSQLFAPLVFYRIYAPIGGLVGCWTFNSDGSITGEPDFGRPTMGTYAGLAILASSWSFNSGYALGRGWTFVGLLFGIVQFEDGILPLFGHVSTNCPLN
jgi:hypothetical protein